MYVLNSMKFGLSSVGFYPEILNNELKKVSETIFFLQRKMKSQAHLIGKCALEKNKKRTYLTFTIPGVSS